MVVFWAFILLLMYVDYRIQESSADKRYLANKVVWDKRFGKK